MLFEIAAKIAMRIPAQHLVATTGIQLHEPNPPLNKPPSHQALPAKVGADGLVHTVHPLSGRSFLIDIDGVRSGHLHAIGQLVTGDAGGRCLFIRVGVQMPLVQASQQIQTGPLLIGSHPGRWIQINDRITLAAKRSSLEGSRQKA